MQNALYTRILLICKQAHAGAYALAEEMAEWLMDQGSSVLICECGDLPGLPLDKEKSLAIVLGGDGTLLGVGRNLAGLSIPILGINFGRVGFLTNTTPKNWRKHVENSLNGKIQKQPRLVLNWRLIRHQKDIAKGHAVNDVVVSHGDLARLVSIHITINGENMGVLRCDGVIFATPMGSSGYTASAGGPILFAKTDAYVFTPICPFLRTVSPMVVPSTVVFHVRLEQRSECCLTLDGQEGHNLFAGDVLALSATPDAVYFLGDDEVFLKRLRTRGLALEQSY